VLCERLADPACLADRRYIAKPKLDGQRAQLHVRGGRALACYRRRGLELRRHPAWVRELAWPVDSAVLDGEACAGDGHEGIQAVFTGRKRPDGAMALVLFDVLQLHDKSIMRKPWRDRR
jgi:ATP-dependent DNA ligase